MKREVQGSFTVEAVFVVPLMIVLTALLLHCTIQLYSEADQAAQDVKELREMNTVELFKEKQL